MMNDVIKIINQLQFVFQSTGYDKIQLPQIVVVGTQSCGKSSVLESLVGRSFLPRGSGIVTRCPIMLQLTNIQEKEDDIEEWCVFTDDPDTKYTDYDKVRQQIEFLTEKSAGKNKGISMEPIIVQVYSPHVVSLTVVDLPGIVKNPVGDQPDDIEDQVYDLINEYIENENALILAVSPGNADIATSDSIKIAKSVDLNGDRTLGVITKLDILDKGTNALKVLDGEIIKLKLGIIGVINRSQQDIDNNTTIESAMTKEQEFFQKYYPTKIGEIGTSFLASQLNELLIKHIKTTLPGLIKRINDLNHEYLLKKKNLGPEIKVSGQELSWTIFQVVEDFIKDFDLQVKGRRQLDFNVINIDQTQLLGARLANVFDILNTNIGKQCNNIEALDHTLLSKAIGATVNVERFTSIEEVFKLYARHYINNMAQEAVQCAEKVHGIFKDAIGHSLKDRRLLKLNDEIAKVTKRLLKCQLDATLSSIHQYIEIQTEMIFSTDEKFQSILQPRFELVKQVDDLNWIGEIQESKNNLRPIVPSVPVIHCLIQKIIVKSIVPHNLRPTNRSATSFHEPIQMLNAESFNLITFKNFALRPSQQPDGTRAVSLPVSSSMTNDQAQSDYVRKLVQTYVNVVRYQICDYMPKHIMFYLYESTKRNLKNEMVNAVAGRESQLVQEDERVMRKRKEIQNMLSSLEQAIHVISAIEDNS